MGCNSSKSAGTSNSQHELQGTLTSVVPCEIAGTTALAFFTRDGIILAVDSRLTCIVKLLNEKISYIKDDEFAKMYPISEKIITLVVGDDMKACKKLCIHLHNQFAGMEPEYITVSDVATTATSYLQSLRDPEGKSFGMIIAGWEENSGYQIHRIQRNNGQVVNQQKLTGFTILGSGQFYSSQVLSHTGDDYGNCQYDYNMPVDRSVQLAVNALFNATYYDKGTGGTIRVYHVNEEFGWTTRCWKDPLEAYSNLYHIYDDTTILYLIVVSPVGSRPVETKLLMKHFRDYKILFAHCVAHVNLKNESVSLSFHRLEFRSRDEATRAYYEKTFTHARTDPELMNHFNKQLDFPEKPGLELYVNWSSEALLGSIREQFQGYLDLVVDNDITFDPFE